MTVSTTTNKITYAGDGATTNFTFPFPGVAATDIQVITVSNTGVITILPANQYTIVLNPPIAPNPTGIGGQVTLLGTPLPVGSSVTILRTLPLIQGTSLANQAILYQIAIESALDYVTMLCQQLNELENRAIVVPATDPQPTPLPAAAARATLFMAFDSAGNPIATPGTIGNVVVSSVMVPVVTASTLANARAAMGVGTPNLGLQLGVSGAGLMDANSPIVHVPGSFTILPSHHMTRFSCDTTLTITLPRANTLWNGFGFWISTRTHALTVTPNAADSINVLPAGASLNIQPMNPSQPGPFTYWMSTDAAAAGVWLI